MDLLNQAIAAVERRGRRRRFHLYVIRDQGTGAVKIGSANDPSTRIRQLQTGCPNELRLEVVHHAAGELEPEFHFVFRPDNIRGEWYPRGSLAERVVVAWRPSEHPGPFAAAVTLRRAIESLPAADAETINAAYDEWRQIQISEELKENEWLAMSC